MGFSDSTQKIFRGSSNTATSSLVDEETMEADYSNGIPVAKYVNKNGFLYLDIDSTTRIGLFGSSGSGKTTGAKSIMVRERDRTGRELYNGADVGNEFQYLDYKGGASKELVEKMGLAPNENPHPVKKKIFMPKFLTEYYNRVPSYVEVFSLGFQDVEESDFKFLMSQGLNQKQIQILELALDRVEFKSTSFSELEAVLDELDVHTQAVKPVKRQLRAVESKGIISNRFQKDVLGFLEDGYAVSLGLENSSKLGRSDLYKAEFYAAVMFRRLKERVLEGGLSEGKFVFFGEAHRFAPAGEDSLLKDEIEDLMTYSGRRIDAPLVLDSQRPSQIPNTDSGGSHNFLSELNYVFLGCDRHGKALAWSEAKSVLKSMNLTNRSNLEGWKKRMQGLEARNFLFVQPSMSGPGDALEVEFLAPLVSNP